jgi:hypothetical protein
MSNDYFIKVWFQLIEQLVPDKKMFMWISHRFLC